MLENNYSETILGFTAGGSVGSWYQLLREKYAIAPTYAGETTVEMVRADFDSVLAEALPGDRLERNVKLWIASISLFTHGEQYYRRRALHV